MSGGFKDLASASGPATENRVPRSRRRQPFRHLSGVHSEALEPLAILQGSHT